MTSSMFNVKWRLETLGLTQGDKRLRPDQGSQLRTEVILLNLEQMIMNICGLIPITMV